MTTPQTLSAQSPHLVKAARFVVQTFDYAASFDTVNHVETARTMGALGVWEAITQLEGEQAVDFARQIVAAVPAES